MSDGTILCHFILDLYKNNNNDDYMANSFYIVFSNIIKSTYVLETVYGSAERYYSDFRYEVLSAWTSHYIKFMIAF